MTRTIVGNLPTCQELANCKLTLDPAYAPIALMGREINIVAERLRRTRLALGYGRGRKTAFANRIGVDKGDYTKFEQGERALPLSAGIRIKQEFGVPLDWIFCGDKAHLSTDLYEKIIQIRQAA